VTRWTSIPCASASSVTNSSSGDFALGNDTGLNPASQARQFAVIAAIALAARCQRTGLASQFDELVDEFRRHSKVPRRLPVSVTVVDVIKHAFP
jgi:hypothetical protein